MSDQTPMNIGHKAPGGVIPMAIDLRALRGAHLGVIANSGSGKSGLIRKILEVSHGEVQQIILDPEDEYYTLREDGDYVIAGGDDGDCPATVANAPALADMLLTSGVSAVIQMNHLKGDEPQRFVAAFLDALMEAPRALWHPVLLVLDEAHRFIPQDGTTAATEAVRDFFARGRKRGYTGVLATQRMASIEKMVTGNMNNWALGRVGQATDRKVVLNMLGFTATSADGKTLMSLENRTFWMFGQGLGAKIPTLMYVDDATTTIVESGEAKIPTAPPPAALAKLLEGLKAPPAPDVPDTPPNAAQGPSEAEHEVRRKDAWDAGRRVGFEEGFHYANQAYREALGKAVVALELSMDEVVSRAPPRQVGVAAEPLKKGDVVSVPIPLNPDSEIRRVKLNGERALPSPIKISRAVQDIIAFYESIHPRAVPFQIAAKQAGVGMKSSQFRTYEPELVATGAVEDAGGGRYRARVASGSPAEYLDKVDVQLAPKHRAIFRFIRGAGRPVNKDEIIAAADVSPTSSTTAAALSLLQFEAEVVEKVGDHYQLAEAFR